MYNEQDKIPVARYMNVGPDAKEEDMPINPRTGKRVKVVDMLPFFRAVVTFAEEVVDANGYPLSIDAVSDATMQIMSSLQPDSPLFAGALNNLTAALIEKGYVPTESEYRKKKEDLLLSLLRDIFPPGFPLDFGDHANQGNQGEKDAK